MTETPFQGREYRHGDAVPPGTAKPGLGVMNEYHAEVAVVREFISIIVAQAKAATAGMERPGYLQISRVHPISETIVPTRYSLDDVDVVEHMVGDAIADCEAAHNVYVEARTIREDAALGNGRGKIEDTRAVFAWVIDSDGDKQMAWKPNGSASPSMIVETSPENHHYWLFAHEAVNAELGQLLGERIRKAAGCDHDTGTITQPYRVAGTVNYPNKKKIERGRVTVATRIAEFNPEELWTRGRLEQAFQLPSKASDGSSGGGNDGAQPDEDNIPADTMRVIRDGPSASANNRDRSQTFWNVMVALKRLGFTVEGIVSLLERHPDGIAKKYEGRLRQEVERVYNKIESVDEPQDPKPRRPDKTSTLDQVIEVFDRWLVLRNHTPVYAALGTVAANLLPGDPVWLGLIAPPAGAKTEIINALSGLHYVEPTATLTPASLLSGTPKRQRDKAAKGGLLRKIGEFGILCLKDFGSILSMRPEAKGEILAALREIYDGSWTRHLGTDGGQTLSWTGKLGFVFGATEAYDDHYGVIGSLGDRFLLCRPASSDVGQQLRKALKHTGLETKVMRTELAGVVAELFANELLEPAALTDDEIQRLNNVVKLAVCLRAHVTRDRYSREIESIHGAEGPGRLVLSLERLFAGLVAIGLSRGEALRIVEGIALDSTPPIRRHAFELLTETPTTTRDIAKALKLPTTTARRTLQELAAHGLAVRARKENEEGEEQQSGADLWHLDPAWTWWPAAWATTATP